MKYNLCLALIASMLWTAGAFAEDRCSTTDMQRREPQIKEALEEMRAGWDASKDLSPYWVISLGDDPHDNDARSKYEITTSMASLVYRFKLTRYEAYTTLNEAYHTGEVAKEDWSSESDARLAEAALVRGKAPYAAFRFAQLVSDSVNPFTFRALDWKARDVIRVSATALVMAPDASSAGLKNQVARTIEVMKEYDQFRPAVPNFFMKGNTSDSNHSAGRLSMLAEITLLTGKTPEEVIGRLNEIHDAAGKLTFNMDSVDYYLVLRAALVADASGQHVAQVLQNTYDIAEAQSSWVSRDYAKVAAAVIAAKITDPNVGGCMLKSALANQTIAPNWRLPDYSEMAATAILGQKAAGETITRYW